MAVVVVMPSRGRPERAHEAVKAIRRTAARVDTSVILAVDRDDPAFGEYAALRWAGFGPEVTVLALPADETGNLVRATNTVSLRVANADPDAIIGNLGDDHVCRSRGWDNEVTDALRDPGVAYGDDLLQGEVLPTAPFISASIVLALGYYFLPDLEHMYCDNAVRDIGVQSQTLHYLPSVVIEHMHPLVGKAEWDEAYRQVNAELPVRLDRLRYESWRRHAMSIDVGRVRDALAA